MPGLKTINIKHDMPTVEEARKRLLAELASAKAKGFTAITRTGGRQWHRLGRGLTRPAGRLLVVGARQSGFLREGEGDKVGVSGIVRRLSGARLWPACCVGPFPILLPAAYYKHWLEDSPVLHRSYAPPSRLRTVAGNFGLDTHMTRRIAVKRLAAVEISSAASNQHEFNAGGLRKALAFPEGRSAGRLTLLFYSEDGKQPFLDEGRYTLYDSRENQPHRSAEYRLYYDTPSFDRLARESDLLVLFRESGSGELQGIVVRAGTDVERAVQSALRLKDSDGLHRFFSPRSGETDGASAVTLAASIAPIDTDSRLKATVNSHATYLEAVAKSSLPSTRQMAEAGREIASAIYGHLADPDDFVWHGLEVESTLFFAIEREIGNRSLKDLIGRSDVEINDVLTWAMQRQQSRKSRRGQSLQHHFSALLTRDAVPFTAQCETERGETPDFVIPGKQAYWNREYPADQLRMVACKSTVRERWGQILKEADRIQEKYLLTVDDSLTDDVIESMHQAGLRAFLPKQVIQEFYSQKKAGVLLRSVGSLISNLKAVL